MLNRFFIELRRRNGPLFWFGWLNVFMLVAAVLLYFVDDTIITGINAWIKPMKFAISITVYSWTFAWLLDYIPSVKKRNFITWGVIICMLVENTLIFMQAGRGVRSHFNVQTTMDGMIFSTMGFFILINTFLILYTIILFFKNDIKLEDRTMLWAWRIGLTLFFLGGISGGIMSARLAHTFGAEDGGAGLPFVNWSTVAGDIRMAHFFTLHGLQIIPLIAMVLIRISRENAGTMLAAVSTLYIGICLWMHWLAFSEIPLISLH